MAHSAICVHLVKLKYKAEQKFKMVQKFVGIGVREHIKFGSLLATVCKMKHFIFLAICKFEWMISSMAK